MEIWFWIIGIVVVVAVIAVVIDRRRGQSVSSAPVDFNTTNRSGGGYDGEPNGAPTSFGGGPG